MRKIVFVIFVIAMSVGVLWSCGDDVRSPEEPRDNDSDIIVDAGGGDEDTGNVDDPRDATDAADVRSCKHPTLPIPIPCRDYRDADVDSDTTDEDTNSPGDGDSDGDGDSECLLDCGDGDGDGDSDSDGDGDGDGDSWSPGESTEGFSCEEIFPGDLTCHATAESGMCQKCRNTSGVEDEDLFSCVEDEMENRGHGCGF